MNDKIAEKKPAKVLAIECFALNPDITTKEVAAQVGVSPRTISYWREDPMFIDKIYERYMTEFGSQLPAVIVLWLGRLSTATYRLLGLY